MHQGEAFLAAEMGECQQILVKAELVFLKPGEVAERSRSPISLMPEGLLSRLSRDEVLDLVAFIEARCDRGHKVFQGGCGHPAPAPAPPPR